MNVEEKEKQMPENPPAETAGMRSMFWVWTAVIFGGLITMIVIPLTGA